MSLNKKYANLPDLTATVRTNDSDDEVPSNPDIDRNGLNAEEARLHFLRASVDTRDVDFSDTIATKRKSYRTKTLRTRRRADGTEEVGDLSDSEEETFERKLARLRREAEELKEELARRKEQQSTKADQQQPENEADVGDGLEELSRALDNIHASTRGASGNAITADTILSQKLAATSQPVGAGSQDKNNSTSEHNDSPAATSTPSGLLAHAASFDARLALVEAALGISTSSNPFIGEGNSEPPLQPVLPALEHLTSRLSALTSTLGGPAPAPAVPTTGSGPATTAGTTPQIEALTARIKKLTADADALANSRKRAMDAAKAANAAKVQADLPSDLSASSSNATEVADPASTQRDEQAAKIQALYATLPTIQSLHPLLPSVLERLRSLRAIHAGAAQASETLDALEKDQAELSKEIEQWREGLRVVEEKVKESEAAMKKNIDVISPWVKDLETRLARLENQT
ncbi:hypothetical protein T310_4582 [Rasamsonia emersonii CBS 393.64]|uniref:Dynactin subunit n=1 Tax=Rasamsonia emersonii (strain ATCC 16479 / CBS 393.64 / IMI 116815) TaxID=1408163 RepID=A0A0F4YU68_RASE3|nr:hypothetical protein T310_4582 [Rasamsonia emersonii CBS 393.64]KKA21401.1 hypothetical protein T310_4582 [Rasamsonia emersonii CBS 393.64]